MFLDGRGPVPALQPPASNMSERPARASCFDMLEPNPERAMAMAAAEGMVLASFKKLAEFDSDLAQALEWIRLRDDERVAALGDSALLEALADPNAVLELGPGLSNARVICDALAQAAQLAAQDYDKQFRL